MTEQKPVHILIADDNPGDLRLLFEAFKDWKMANEIHTASDGEEALKFLYRKEGYANSPRPDLIFLDLNMPKKNGMEVLEEIKSDNDLKRIPVIIMTTSSNKEDVIRTYNLHVNSYVTKPLELDELFKMVRSLENYCFSTVTRPYY